METITLGILIAVFEEMFGAGLFWALVAFAVLLTAGWLFVVVRDRRLKRRKFPLALLSMPVGAAAAGWAMLGLTFSGLRHMGGLIDWFLLLGAAAAGAAVLGMVVHVGQSLLQRPQAPPAA